MNRLYGMARRNQIGTRNDLSGAGPDWFAAMRGGDWARAHRIADAVLASRDRSRRDDPDLPYHQRWVWDGTKPDGDVLVRCYHGLGDTVLFARFLPELAWRARRLTVEAPAALLPLLRRMKAPIGWHPFDEARPLPPAECTAEIMELAHLLRVGKSTLPPCPYLSAPAKPVTGGIGLCWRSGDWDPARSMPAATLVAAARAAFGGARLTGLVPGEKCAGLSAALPAEATIVETASLLTALDHVVSVDTMVANLAGALGRPGTVLLRPEADWRWGGGERSEWYPTLRLRHARPGEWPPMDALLAVGC